MRKPYVYDLETYSDFFSATFICNTTEQSLIDSYIQADIDKNYILKKELLSKIDHRVFIIDNTRCDLNALCRFIEEEVLFLVGYNNYRFDDIIIDWLFIQRGRGNTVELYTDLYNLAGDIISDVSWNYRTLHRELGDKSNYKYYKKKYTSFDIMKILYLDKRKISLKQVSIWLNWYRVQDLPHDFRAKTTKAIREDVIDYNINDVLITRALWYNQINEVNLRVDITQLYGINVMNDSRSSIANTLMTNFYAEYTGLHPREFKSLRTTRRSVKMRDILSPMIEFETPNMQAFYNNIKKDTIKIGGVDANGLPIKFGYELIHEGVKYTIAKGGLHSVDRPAILKSNDKYTYKDADVTSYYPSLILNNKVCPEHLNKMIFLYILEMLVKERVEAKAIMNTAEKGSNVWRDAKTKSEALKIVINVVYGEQFAIIGLIAGIS